MVLMESASLAKTVPVRPRFTGEGANGYVVAQWFVGPPTLPVVGPASHVAPCRTRPASAWFTHYQFPGPECPRDVFDRRSERSHR